MRTFSKIYGLAGLRLGYGIGTSRTHRRARKNPSAVQHQFPRPSRRARGAGRRGASAQNAREQFQRIKHFLETEFRRMKLEFVPSAANFILVRVGDGQSVFERIAKARRHRASDGRLSIAGMDSHFHRHARVKTSVSLPRSKMFVAKFASRFSKINLLNLRAKRNTSSCCCKNCN